MPFVDQLRNVDTRTPRQRDFDECLASMHNAIKQYCIGCARENKSHATGYIIRNNDCEQSTNEKRYLTQSYLYEKVYRYVPDYLIPSVSSAKGRNKYRQPCLNTDKIFVQKQICQEYLNALYPLLLQDGFKSITLNLVECKNKYAVIKEEGLFKKTYYKELVETNEIIGYTIEFILTW